MGTLYWQGSSMSTNFLICSVTRGKKEDTQLFKSCADIPVKFFENNTKSLAEVYNYILRVYGVGYIDYLIFCHDDVTIQYPDKLIEVLEEGGKHYDVMGLAGAKSIEIKRPTLWHLMSKRQDWRGSVSHLVNENQHMVTSFGPMPDRCLVIDGLFIAVKTNALTDYIRFDETNEGKWHLYDMDFCLTCNKHQKRIGVIDFPVIHSSPGLMNAQDESFISSQEWFIRKWGNA